MRKLVLGIALCAMVTASSFGVGSSHALAHNVGPDPMGVTVLVAHNDGPDPVSVQSDMQVTA